MPKFLLELYMPRSDDHAVAAGAIRGQAGAEGMTRNGTPVRYVGSLYIPEEETCFQLYEAACARHVRDAAGLAALRYVNVLEAVTEPPVLMGG